MRRNSVPAPGRNLVNSEMERLIRINQQLTAFCLSSDLSFASRSSDVFDELNPLERDHNSWLDRNKIKDSPDDDKESSTSAKPDSFKKPFAPTKKKGKASAASPRRNMKKWKKYSLADTPLSSDGKNASVALQFMDELKKKKKNKVVKEVATMDVFRKPMKRKQEVSETITSSDASVSKKAKSSNLNIKLDHLHDNEEL